MCQSVPQVIMQKPSAKRYSGPSTNSVPMWSSTLEQAFNPDCLPLRFAAMLRDMSRAPEGPSRWRHKIRLHLNDKMRACEGPSQPARTTSALDGAKKEHTSKPRPLLAYVRSRVGTVASVHY